MDHHDLRAFLAASSTLHFGRAGREVNLSPSALGRTIRRPAILRVPGFALRIALGEFSLALLRGQKVIPAKLLAAGFVFRYPDIDSALANILSRPK